METSMNEGKRTKYFYQKQQSILQYSLKAVFDFFDFETCRSFRNETEAFSVSERSNMYCKQRYVTNVV